MRQVQMRQVHVFTTKSCCDILMGLTGQQALYDNAIKIVDPSNIFSVTKVGEYTELTKQERQRILNGIHQKYLVNILPSLKT